MDLVPFHEQLDEYPMLLEMFKTKPPTLPAPPVSPPWRIYAKREADSGWARKDVDTYKEAYRFVRDRLHTYYDISITSKRQAFPPPQRLVKLKRNGQPVMVKTSRGQMIQKTKLIRASAPAGHNWCIYCRRYTVFTFFTTHHAFRALEKSGTYKGITMDPSTRRCCICGISEASGAVRT